MGGGGGGGQTQTTKSGIDPEFKPYIEKGLGISTNLLEGQIADPNTIVAGLTEQQQKALAAQEATAEDMMGGRGIYNTRAAEERSLKNLAGQGLAGASASGSLGSARSQAAMQGALANRAGEYQQQRQQMALEGIKQMGQAGTTRQKQSQRELQARDEALDRFFNRLTGVAPRSSTTTSSGGGK
jgi:hypothetical protein